MKIYREMRISFQETSWQKFAACNLRHFCDEFCSSELCCFSHRGCIYVNIRTMPYNTWPPTNVHCSGEDKCCEASSFCLWRLASHILGRSSGLGSQPLQVSPQGQWSLMSCNAHHHIAASPPVSASSYSWCLGPRLTSPGPTWVP